jgi:hypothetical protein
MKDASGDAHISGAGPSSVPTKPADRLDTRQQPLARVHVGDLLRGSGVGHRGWGGTLVVVGLGRVIRHAGSSLREVEC